jgi:TRAP-type C4-dicarboxylate transport system substrate-binding protein
MRKCLTLAQAMLLCATISTSALTIKLGSLAPIGSPWDVILHKIASQWQTISQGSVDMKIYSGGVAGDEPDMVRKIRIGQLGAAAITVSGLQGVFNGVKVLSFPLFIRNDGERDYVLSHMESFFSRQLEQKGFKVIMWAAGGWVYFFSRQPVVTTDDLRRQKLWVWVGDPDEVQAWQSSGFQVVPLASTDIMTSLQGGMIDALITSPLLAASNQWFGIVNNMCSLKLAPFWGAAVVSTRLWNQIPADLQPRLIEAAQQIADEMQPEIDKADEEAIDVMGKYGLKVTEVSVQAVKGWEEFISKGFDQLIGRSFDTSSYTMAKKYLDEYTAAHPRG